MRIMYKCIYIVVDNQGVVYKSNESAGITGENIQGRINIRFREISQTVEGIAYLEYKRYNPDIKDYEKGLIKMDSTKDDEGKIIMYSIPILSSLLKYAGNIEFQLRITENEIDNYIPVYKSQVFNLSVLEAINAESEIPEEYPTWLDIANEKIQEIDNINISSKETTDGVEIDITNKDGVTTTNKIYNGKKGDKGDTGARGEQGIPGENGKDGYVQYQAGDNITIENNVISASSKNAIYSIEFNNVSLPQYNTIYSSEFGSYKQILLDFISNALNNSYLKNQTPIIFMSFKCSNFISNIPYLILNKSDSNTILSPVASGNFYMLSDVKFVNNKYYYYRIEINYTYENNIFTCTDIRFNKTQRDMLDIYNALSKENTTSFTPTGDYNPSTKLYTDKTHYENMTGYDATKTQVLKNINGVLTWVTEE